MANERITSLEMNYLDIIKVMSKGNPGAITVLMGLLAKGKKIDPDCFAGGHGHILLLDSYNIWEDRIWMFYKDLCGENLSRMIAVLRACQLGKIKEKTLHTWINDGLNHRDDADAAIAKVKASLPKLVVTPF